jgi:hypothetical protein
LLEIEDESFWLFRWLYQLDTIAVSAILAQAAGSNTGGTSGTRTRGQAGSDSTSRTSCAASAAKPKLAGSGGSVPAAASGAAFV